jgi:creatinine amidohydrolase
MRCEITGGVLMTVRISEMPFDEVIQYLNDDGDGVVIPFGTVEPHGRHLPMGTDNLLAQSIGERIAAEFNWLIAPTLNYGVNNTLAMYPGATTIAPEIYAEFVTQIVEGYIKLGFNHIVLNNGHGPNVHGLEHAARKLSGTYPEARIFVISWWDLDKAPREEVYEGKAAGHAALDETAAVIYFHNDLVHKKRFTSDSYCIRKNGFKVYPSPASCIPGDDDSIPDFSAKKAKKFMEMVLDIIYENITDALEGFSSNLLD